MSWKWLTCRWNGCALTPESASVCTAPTAKLASYVLAVANELPLMLGAGPREMAVVLDDAASTRLTR